MAQQKETSNQPTVADVSDIPKSGRILAIDPGTKRCGLAVCDELRVTTRALAALQRTNWKKLLVRIKHAVSEFDAVAVVVGLPLASDGSETDMSVEARSMARKLALSLAIPVCLQDERVTSYEARRRLWQTGVPLEKTKENVDSEAAAVILSDFLDRLSRR